MGQNVSMKDIEKHIKKLEETLLQRNVRRNPDLLDELLDKDFEEIGSSGKITNRLQVMEWLLTKEKDVTWSLDGFRVRQLAPDLVLALYKATKIKNRVEVSGSLRSSIWQRTGDRWKMVFNQGTRVQHE